MARSAIFAFVIISCLFVASAIELKSIFEGEWEIQFSETSLAENLKFEGESNNIKLNVTKQGNALVTSYVDDEKDHEYNVKIDWDSLYAGELLVADEDSDEYKQVLSFDFFNRTGGHLVSQGVFNGISGKATGFYQIVMTSSASFMFNHISADGKVITTITGAKTVKQPTPGFFQKYGSMLMIGAMLIVPRLMKSFLPQPEAPAAAAAAGVPPAGAAKGRRNNNASRIEEIKEETKKEN
jgi:hypothetical protein